MADEDASSHLPAVDKAFGPAAPLWQLVPTRGEDGRCLADFMMLIPRLGSRPEVCRERVALAIREVCESYGRRVAFADINYAINVLWVSLAAEPQLAGRVAQSIRDRVPEALLIGGQLGAAALPALRPSDHRWWPLHVLVRRSRRLLGGPDR
jgi:hypothetical protein